MVHCSGCGLMFALPDPCVPWDCSKEARPFVIRNFAAQWALKRFEQRHGAEMGSQSASERVELANAMIRFEKSIAWQLVRLDDAACL